LQQYIAVTMARLEVGDLAHRRTGYTKKEHVMLCPTSFGDARTGSAHRFHTSSRGANGSIMGRGIRAGPRLRAGGGTPGVEEGSASLEGLPLFTFLTPASELPPGLDVQMQNTSAFQFVDTHLPAFGPGGPRRVLTGYPIGASMDAMAEGGNAAFPLGAHAGDVGEDASLNASEVGLPRSAKEEARRRHSKQQQRQQQQHRAYEAPQQGSWVELSCGLQRVRYLPPL
jgi:hypothetical protein